MKSRNALLVQCAAIAGVTWLFLLLAGCEDNADPTNLNVTPAVGKLTIEPPSATLQQGETYVVLRAVGGMSPFSWWVSDPSLGSVPITTADTITYTRSLDTLGANVVYVRDRNSWATQATVWQNSETNSVPSP